MSKNQILTESKCPVKIRFKPCRNGNKSIYLDIYRKGLRKKEYLKMYLVQENTREDKMINRITLQAVNAIKAERLCRIYKEEAGIKDNFSKIYFIDWMEEIRKKAEKASESALREKSANALGFVSVRDHLKSYIEKNYNRRKVLLSEINKDFCSGFADYLNTVRNKRGGCLSSNTRTLYYAKFSAALNAAVNAGHLSSNPASKLDKAEKPHLVQTEREYLTENELQLLINTPSRHSRQDIKSAFLFSCFCGLRWSDVFALTWSEVHIEGNLIRIEKRIIKTQELLYLPLCREAVFFLPPKEEKGDSDKVFFLLKYCSANRALKKWVLDAGIKKNVSFHTARHTFATLLLSHKQDIYTVSKLLGHKNIKVTQLYAAVVDNKKQEAVDSISGSFSLVSH